MAFLKTANGHGKYRDLSTKKDVVDYILKKDKLRNNYWNFEHCLVSSYFYMYRIFPQQWNPDGF